MPDLPRGGVLLRVLYLSLDAGALGAVDQRQAAATPAGIGQVIAGESVSEVIASDHPGYTPGDFVHGSSGWRTHVASDGTGLRKLDPKLAPLSTTLGVLGTPGFAAYSGITLIGMPTPGETVLVAASSGPVGSLVGQLAKMAGARTVGIAWGAEECRFIRDDLGFDVVVDARMPEFPKTLAAVCPDGIDIYFENAGGGPIWDAALPLLNRFARVPVCGLVTHCAGAGAAEVPDGPVSTLREVAGKSLTLRGIDCEEFADKHHFEFLRTVSQGISGGRICYREDITDGLENAPKAFVKMLEGRIFGAALVRIAS